MKSVGAENGVLAAAGEVTGEDAAGGFDALEPAGAEEDAQPATSMTIAAPSARTGHARCGREIRLFAINDFLMGTLPPRFPIAADDTSLERRWHRVVPA